MLHLGDKAKRIRRPASDLRQVLADLATARFITRFSKKVCLLTTPPTERNQCYILETRPKESAGPPPDKHPSLEGLHGTVSLPADARQEGPHIATEDRKRAKDRRRVILHRTGGGRRSWMLLWLLIGPGI